MELYVTADIRCGISVFSKKTQLFGTDESVFNLPDADCEYVVSAFPADGDGRFMPISVTVNNGDAVSTKNDYGSSKVERTRYISWGLGRFELIVHPPRALSAPLPPKRLSRLDFLLSNGKTAELLLYRDCGLKLLVSVDGVESSYALTDGTDGELSVLDIGSERVLIVKAVCENALSMYTDREASVEKLIVLDERFDVVFTLEGERCFISNGRLTSVCALGTVRGHELRVRYEPFSGQRPDETELSEELGFFTHEAHAPVKPEEAALALMEAVLLVRREEALSLICADLASEIDFDGLCEFFGVFDEARPVPWSTDGRILIGAIFRGQARIFEFHIENGLVSDVDEVEA